MNPIWQFLNHLTAGWSGATTIMVTLAVVFGVTFVLRVIACLLNFAEARWQPELRGSWLVFTRREDAPQPLVNVARAWLYLHLPIAVVSAWRDRLIARAAFSDPGDRRAFRVAFRTDASDLTAAQWRLLLRYFMAWPDPSEEVLRMITHAKAMAEALEASQ